MHEGSVDGIFVGETLGARDGRPKTYVGDKLGDILGLLVGIQEGLLVGDDCTYVGD